MGRATSLASCLMPTCNRRSFVPRAIRQFLEQDYPRRELIVLDDGSDSVADLIPADPRIRYRRLERRLILGDKRNAAAEMSSGEILLHWDDDDWMAPWRVSYQVRRLLERGADACGLDRVYFHDPTAQSAWEYSYAGAEPWLYGGSLCYTRSFWAAHRFAALQEGEDNDFLWRHRPRILKLPDPSFYVGTVHPSNTSRKSTAAASWRPIPVDELPSVGPAGLQLPPPPEPPRDGPLVSCLMPTGGRKAFALQSIRYFQQQTYPHRELLVLDDGTRDLADEIPADPRIRYLRLERKLSVGAKLDFGIEKSRGTLIARWDDDDWYSPHRLTVQATGLLKSSADLCGFRPEIVYELDRDRFWRCSAGLCERLYFAGVALGGVLMFRRKLWEQGLRHADVSLAEDFMFARSVAERGGEILKLDYPGLFVYIRHGRNTWRFLCGSERGAEGWEPISRPSFLPDEDMGFYRSLHGDLALPPSRPVHAPPARLPVPVRGPGLRPAGAVIRRVLF